MKVKDIIPLIKYADFQNTDEDFEFSYDFDETPKHSRVIAYYSDYNIISIDSWMDECTLLITIAK